MTGTGFNLMGGLWNRGGSGEGHRRRGEAWRGVGEVHRSLYRGVVGVLKD
jgi:hypothetical protein